MLLLWLLWLFRPFLLPKRSQVIPSPKGSTNFGSGDGTGRDRRWAPKLCWQQSARCSPIPWPRRSGAHSCLCSSEHYHTRHVFSKHFRSGRQHRARRKPISTAGSQPALIANDARSHCRGLFPHRAVSGRVPYTCVPHFLYPLCNK